MIDDDIAPRLHMRNNRFERFLVILAKEFQSSVREDNTEAERGDRRILFKYGNGGARLSPLDQIGEIETGRSGADNRDMHTAILPETAWPQKRALAGRAPSILRSSDYIRRFPDACAARRRLP